MFCGPRAKQKLACDQSALSKQLSARLYFLLRIQPTFALLLFPRIIPRKICKPRRFFQDISHLYQFVALFEPSDDIKCRMHKRRLDILIAALNELNPQYYLAICR